MDESRLNDLEKRVTVGEVNGWHDKYILEKLDTLTAAVKEVRVETCKSLDRLKDDNTSAHKILHDKLDAQKTMCANRPMECQKQFLPARTFGWLVIILVVLFGTSFSLSGTALKQNAGHETRHALVEKRIENHERDITADKINEIENRLEQNHPAENEAN